MFGRLDRYFLKELALTTLYGMVLALVILLALQGLRLSDLIVRVDMDFGAVFRMVAGLGLSFTPLILPISFLFALLFVFGRMSTDRELVALQAMGRSPTRLLIPCLAFGLFVSGCALYFSFWLGPKGNQQFEISIDEAFKKKVANAVRAGTFSEDFMNLVLFVDELDPISQKMTRVFIHDETNFKVPVSISASRGQWVLNETDGVGVLKLNDGLLVSTNEEKGTIQRIQFKEYRVNNDLSKQVGLARDSPPSLDLHRLLEKRSAFAATPSDTADPRPIWIEIARRFAVSLACLLFVPLCFSLSIDNRRTARSQAIGLGLLLLVSYWTLYFTFVTWALKSPVALLRVSEPLNWLVVWLPNFLLLFAAFASNAYRQKKMR